MDDPKKKEVGLLDPVVKPFHLISSLQDIQDLENRHEALEKVRRTGQA